MKANGRVLLTCRLCSNRARRCTGGGRRLRGWVVAMLHSVSVVALEAAAAQVYRSHLLPAMRGGSAEALHAWREGLCGAFHIMHVIANEACITRCMQAGRIAASIRSVQGWGPARSEQVRRGGPPHNGLPHIIGA
jgi:hypothetical protein